MLATLPPNPDRSGPMNTVPDDAEPEAENRICPGCKDTVMTEDGGVVVAFGQSFFHVDCFKCAKCNNKVTADTNLLLLSDGSPVCANCSYSCNVCHQPILDEAIMTGDDSYHAHCFNCKVCKKRIDELVFAKTSQGIYCMDCHNERVARSRRHQQRREKEKAQARERAAAANAEMKDTPGKEEASPAQPPSRSTMSPQSLSSSQNGTPISSLRSQGMHSAPRSGDQVPLNTSLRRESVSSMGERVPRSESPARLGHSVSLPQPTPAPQHPPSLTPANGLRQQTLSPQQVSRSATSDHSRSATLPPAYDTIDSLDVTDKTNKTVNKRKSFDDRPLNILLQEAPAASQSNGLAVPNSGSSRAERRRSINPVFAMSFTASEPPPASRSPTASSFNQPSPRSETPPSRVVSPLREHFSPNQGIPHPSTPPPTVSSFNSSLSNNHDHLNGRARSASSGTHPEQAAPRAPLRPVVQLDRVPLRTSSRLDQGEGNSGFTPVSPDSGRRYPDGRLSPVVSSPLRSQKSFDDRPRQGNSSLRNSSSSINLGQTITVPPRNETQPTSPSHRVDVPHGIESGTDSEAEDQSPGDDSNDDLPPMPPPKEAKGTKVGTRRPPELKLGADHEVEVSETMDNSEELDASMVELESYESSPVEQTSHATYIAPALPPIRFSMSGADFSELLKSVGSPTATKSPMTMVKEAVEASETTLKLNTKQIPQEIKKPISTPTSEITIIGSDGSHNDTTPVRRRGNEEDVDHTIRRNRQRSHSPTPQGHGHATSIARSASDFPKRSLDGLSDSSHGSDITPIIDIYTDRGPSASSSRVGLPPRPSLEGRSYSNRDGDGRNGNLDASHRATAAQLRMTSSEGSTVNMNGRMDSGDLVKQRLQEAVSDANSRGVAHVKLNLEFVDAILELLDQRKQQMGDLKKKLDGFKRASQQYMDGLTVAQTEYDAELKARREAEAEVTRLRILLSGQAVQLTAISGETKRQETQRKLSRQMSDDLTVLERSLSKLKVERDLTLAEMDELSATKSSQTIAGDGDNTARLGRALSTRFENIKSQYAHQLLPLTEEREALLREVEDLKASREAFLEETTMLNARNEELAQLNAQYIRRLEQVSALASQHQDRISESSHDMRPDPTAEKLRMLQNLTASLSSSTLALTDESNDTKVNRVHNIADIPTPQQKTLKFPKWGASKAPKENVPLALPDLTKGKQRMEHSFQQVSVLRPQRCDHCGDKMWGSQLRCSHCNIALHTRCVHHIHLQCTHPGDILPLPVSNPPSMIPSMFGRDLAEQVRADSKDGQRFVPMIVDKCIDAVDFHGLEYEGIYRKTGGTRLCKIITSLFERGEYDAFDLRDEEEFNDICSITSVLKNYFRQLPNPLFTFALHDKFIEAANVKEPDQKTEAMRALVSELPTEHYYTARALMLHLSRVRDHSEVNLMHARNLGVVFGPTLMRHPDATKEFSDMAGKALSVEWLVDHAEAIFDNGEEY
ncbi:RhoGAP-domain-containing protein [Cristinia sonorae]|uniref:RhoGAP-domain-containing protein n=1 Tax=Cristinia sonorae TaxID=1940300 RepID=A0A8K0XV25_9AGAR|nr:RhoGAP-domain-containing protein [Cristinia sonorae]